MLLQQRPFGIEIETITRTRDHVARAIQNVVGGEVRYRGGAYDASEIGCGRTYLEGRLDASPYWTFPQLTSSKQHELMSWPVDGIRTRPRVYGTIVSAIRFAQIARIAQSPRRRTFPQPQQLALREGVGLTSPPSLRNRPRRRPQVRVHPASAEGHVVSAGDDLVRRGSADTPSEKTDAMSAKLAHRVGMSRRCIACG